MTQTVRVICHQLDTGDLALTLTKYPSKYCHQDKLTANAPKYKSHGKSCQGHQFNKVANRSRNIMMTYLKATLLLVVGLQLLNSIQANKVRYTAKTTNFSYYKPPLLCFFMGGHKQLNTCIRWAIP